MRHLILSAIFLISIFSCNQKSNEHNSAVVAENIDTVKYVSLDSININHPFLASSPFTENSETDFFNQLVKNLKPTKEIFEKNIHDTTQYNTIKYFLIGKSEIQTLTTPSGKILIKHVSLKDDQISLKNNLKVGSSLNDVISKFDLKADSSKHYKFIQINNSNAGEQYLKFNFSNNKISNIHYQPYID